MARFLHPQDIFTVSKFDKAILAFLWTFGLGFGAVVFESTGSYLISQIPLAAKVQPSLFGLLVTASLPFWFSAFLVYLAWPRGLYGLCFIKAFLFAYISQAVFQGFDSAGWLIRWLLLFTDICGSAVLYRYWHHHIAGARAFRWRSFLIGQTALGIIACTDFCIISPLLRRCLF